MEGTNHFDYLVIGAGSGGVASARWTAAKHGTKVAIIEHGRLGGTCVNVGCVPKKCMFNCASVLEDIHMSDCYGISGTDGINFDFSTLKKHRDNYSINNFYINLIIYVPLNYVKFLNGIYGKLLDGSKVNLITGWAKFVDNKTIEVNGTDRYTADHILIATGSRPNKLEFKGAENTISSDEFFNIEELPKKVVVLGGGYIATELGQILHAFGTKVIQVVRSEILTFVDDEVRNNLLDCMKLSGYDLRKGINISEVNKVDTNNLTVHFSDCTIEENVDYVLSAVGRSANIDNLGLENTTIQVSPKGYIEADDYEQTNVEGVYAIGDVTGKIELTPVAIKAGRTLVERLFNKRSGLKMDYENVPTVIFSHPPIGVVGLSEKEAKETFGEENVGVYKSKFTNMFYSLMQVETEKKPKSLIKYVTNKLDDERVVGVHMCGRNVDEMLQAVGIAIKMGATKKDFDRCVAIHPTGSEELVLCDP